ncbi:MAG TPA: M20/M25/M40 family metallo-hydrolase [Vicinamibacterales bacterium]|nr:M20/M25/M40 family metallo-hydrolase [Vicinamibacterales bacterium]
MTTSPGWRVDFAVAALLALGPGARPSAVQAPGAGGELDPRIEKLVASISEERLAALLTRLVRFTTRDTFSDPDSPGGIGAARQWIFDELQRTSPRLQVSFDTHAVPAGGRVPRAVELRNVLAILPGRTPRRIYVSGHYDSLTIAPRGQTPRPPPDYDAAAPGANDDGSGTVVSMELARVFAESGIEFDATLVFMAVAGEEYGLLGSRAHARRMKEQKVPVQALFNNDIVGNSMGGNGIPDGATVRLYAEGPEDSPSRSLAQFTRRIAEKYVPSHLVRLMARRDRFGRGGDHSGFNAEGFAAVGFRESRENYSKQHNANDTIDGVSFPYLAQNARVNAAGMAVLALAPPPPVVTASMLGRQPSGYDARLRWPAAPGAAGYRIFWRDAWAPDWQHELFAGQVTEYIFKNKNIDDHVFGVAAVGAQGHESTISAYVNLTRGDQ